MGRNTDWTDQIRGLDCSSKCLVRGLCSSALQNLLSINPGRLELPKHVDLFRHIKCGSSTKEVDLFSECTSDMDGTHFFSF